MISRRTSSLLAPLLAGWTVVIAACAGERPAPEQPPAAPSARILQPADGDTVVSPDVHVMLGVEGVQVVAATGQRVEGQGHHHLFVDRDLTPPDSVIPAGVAGIVHIGTGATEYTLSGLAPGAHRIIAVLAYGNHVPMAGVASDTVRVVVK